MEKESEDYLNTGDALSVLREAPSCCKTISPSVIARNQMTGSRCIF